MRWFVVPIVALALAVVARAESQPRLPAALDQAVIRVQSQGNEMIVMRQAPVLFDDRADLLRHRLAPECRPGAPPDRPRIPGRGD